MFGLWVEGLGTAAPKKRFAVRVVGRVLRPPSLGHKVNTSRRTRRELDVSAIWNLQTYRLPETNIFAPENRPGPKRKLVLQLSICRCENVSFRGG